jgi:VWFA-related protein
VRTRLCSVLILFLVCVLTPAFSQSPAQIQPSPQKPETQEDVLRIETDLVTTLFTALDPERRFVTSLSANDVRILENGKEQQISLFERETDRPLTMVVLIDTSGSQEQTLPQEKAAAKLFVEAVVRPNKDMLTVVSFTGIPKVESPLTNSTTIIKQAIDRVTVEIPPQGCERGISPDEDPRCWTGLWDSIVASVGGLRTSARKGGRRVIVVLTDGDDTSSKATRDEATQTAVRNDVVIYGIGIGDPDKYRLDKGALRKLAEKTGGAAFFPREQAELTAAFNRIEEEMRSQYVIAYVPTNRARDGTFRKLKIEVVNPELRRRKLTLVHRQGYYARQN